MDMSGSGLGAGSFGSGGSESSAGASGPPAEEASAAHHSMFGPGVMMRGSGSDSNRQGPGSAEFSGALGSFFKRTSQMEESSGGVSSRFSTMFRDLKSDDGTRQITALTELSEYLSFSSEEALISFPMEAFIPVLIGLLEDPGHGDETAAQAMVLCCRCLFSVVDILPPTTRIIVAAGGLPVLCANLLNVAYIDVAELAVAIMERISEDQPLQALRAGGLQAILTFLDFFQIAVQRQAVSAAALMLLPIPPPDVFDQHVRTVLPTLSQLLQHTDPQVTQSVCECWRRLLDITVVIHGWPRSASHSAGTPSSFGRMVSKGKWRGSLERGKRDRGDEAVEHGGAVAGGSPSASAAAPSASPSSMVSSVLEEMCPSGVLSHLLVLLTNAITSPSPHTSVVMAEALYILSVLTNYSDDFTREVLHQDIIGLLRQIVLSMDLLRGDHSSSQSSFALLRVLAAVGSMLPAIHLTDLSCDCEEKRLNLFMEEPALLDAIGETFLPVLVDAYEASMDPSLQPLCVTLLLALFLTCRERPDTIRRSLDPTRVACLLANLLLVGTSRSVLLACLLIVYELLERHPEPYSLLFVRHGVARGIHQLVTREGEPQRRSACTSGKAAAQRTSRSRTTASPAAVTSSKAQLVDVAAHRVLSSYFASSAHTGESAILRSLGKITQQLRSSPATTITAHREALNKLHDLLLASDGITAFEFTCSGTAKALTAFLYPQLPPGASGAAAVDLNEIYGDRLRLFLECIGKSSSGAFVRLVRLCTSALQRVDRQPMNLFPTMASLSTALPPHLRLHATSPQVRSGFAGKGGGDGSSPSGQGAFGGMGGDFPPGVQSRGRGHDSSGAGNSSSLSVLRLLAKPVRVRMAPHGAAGMPSANSGNAMPNMRALLMPFGGKATPLRLLQPKASSLAASSSSSATAATAGTAGGGKGGSPGSDVSAQAQTVSASSPAARLRNYLASKVSRKRSVSTMGGPGSGPPAAASSSAAPAEKRPGGVAGLLMATTKGRNSSTGAAAWAQAQAEDFWPNGGSWDEDDGGSASAGPILAAGPSSAATLSGARGSMDHLHLHHDPRDDSGRRDDGGHRSEAGREREHQDIPGDIIEAVLLVEPLAMVSALEEYIWEKHGLRHAHMEAIFGTSMSSAFASASASALNAPTGAVAFGASAPGPASIGPQDSSSGATTGTASSDSCAAAAAPAAAAAAAPAAAPAPAAATAPDGPRARLFMKQQPSQLSNQWQLPLPVQGAGSRDRDGSPASPRTPLEILDPGTPSALEEAQREMAAAQAQDNDGALSDSEPIVRSTEAQAEAGAVQAGERRRVQIYLNGQPLLSKSSVVQALVHYAGRAASRGRGRDGNDETGHARFRTDRFLVSTEDESNSEGDEGMEGGGMFDGHSGGLHMSSRQFCGAIWGRVHSMTYEIVDEPPSPEAAGERPSRPDAPDEAGAVVATEFDGLVRRHARVAGSIATLEPQPESPGSASCAAAAGATGDDDAAQTELSPRSGGSQGDDGGGDGSGAPDDQEAFTNTLQLVTAFHNIREFLRASQGNFGVAEGIPDDEGNFGVAEGIPDDEDFHCNTLTSKLLRQLSDPLAVCTGSIPTWCTRLPAVCRFLFPYSARRVLHHSCSLGMSRALYHIQQRTLAQSAHSAEMQRRLEGEVAIANIPRQKVRISRQRIVESAIKVMNSYGAGNTILEVEYAGEVGTGSGPTLEFYAQVAEILRTSEPRLFREATPNGLLFPEPMCQCASGGDQALVHQQAIDRFRLLGHIVAKCILDNRLVDLQLHPFFWRAVLGTGLFSQRSLHEVDPELYKAVNRLRDMEDDVLAQLCIDFTLPGHPEIELKPGGAGISLTRANRDEYTSRLTEVVLMSSVAQQAAAFRSAFAELLPLETCRIWSEKEMACIIVGASVHDDALWSLEHLGAHIKAQHGYCADSRCFRDLLCAMADFSAEERRKFLCFVTGAPTLPIGGFGGLKPPLTVVKKEAPPAPLTPDQYMPSVMTCANYLKLPEYSSSEILRQKISLAVREGQSAFLLS